LVRWAFKVGIAQAASPAREQDGLLPVFRDFEKHFTGLRIFGHGTQRHLEYDVLAVRPVAIVSASAAANRCFDVLAVFQVQERPHLVVAFQNDVAAAPSIAPVGTPFGDATRSVEMRTSRAALTGGTENFDVIDEVVVRHAYRA